MLVLKLYAWCTVSRLSVLLWTIASEKEESKKKHPANYWSVGFQLFTSKKREKAVKKRQKQKKNMKIKHDLARERRVTKTQWNTNEAKPENVVFLSSLFGMATFGKKMAEVGMEKYLQNINHNLKQWAKIAYLDLDLLSSTWSVFQEWHKPSGGHGIHEEEQEGHLGRLHAKHRPAAHSHLLFQLWDTGGTSRHKL